MYKPDNENLQKMWVIENNSWNIPEIAGIKEVPQDLQFVSFNHCLSLAKSENTANYSISYWLDDYQFNRVWNKPNKYLNLLKKFEYVL